MRFWAGYWRLVCDGRFFANWNYSALFIIVLLVLIFRSLTLALVTIAPAVFSVIISGPLVA